MRGSAFCGRGGKEELAAELLTRETKLAARVGGRARPRRARPPRALRKFATMSPDSDDSDYCGAVEDDGSLTRKERARKGASRCRTSTSTGTPARAVLDAQGKLMPKGHFHGAFTGGFSAGYFNSVGSRAGAAAVEVIARRAQKQQQRPDFRTPRTSPTTRRQKLVARRVCARANCGAGAGGRGRQRPRARRAADRLLRVSDTAENAGWAMPADRVARGLRRARASGAAGRAAAPPAARRRCTAARAGRRRRSGWLRRRRRRMS